jgi:hypothetical protein
MELIAPLLVGVAFFVLIGWVTYVIVDGKRRRERLKVFTDFHTKLVDRMGSASEFNDFLQSPGGQRFLATLSTERGGPKAAIMRSVHTGIVMLALGLGLSTLRGLLVFDSEAGAFVTFVAVVCVALALGFLASGAVSWWLGRSLGVMEDEWTPAGDRRSR